MHTHMRSPSGAGPASVLPIPAPPVRTRRQGARAPSLRCARARPGDLNAMAADEAPRWSRTWCMAGAVPATLAAGAVPPCASVPDRGIIAPSGRCRRAQRRSAAGRGRPGRWPEVGGHRGWPRALQGRWRACRNASTRPLLRGRYLDAPGPKPNCASTSPPLHAVSVAGAVAGAVGGCVVGWLGGLRTGGSGVGGCKDMELQLLWSCPASSPPASHRAPPLSTLPGSSPLPRAATTGGKRMHGMRNVQRCQLCKTDGMGYNGPTLVRITSRTLRSWPNLVNVSARMLAELARARSAWHGSSPCERSDALGTPDSARPRRAMHCTDSRLSPC